MEYIKERFRILITIISAIVIIIYSFFIVFYSPVLTNTSQIINLRESYQNSIYKVIRVFQKDKQPIIFNPLYTFTVRKWEGLYYYTFTGTFVKSEAENGLIYLKSKEGKIYSFKVSKKFIASQADFKLNNLGFEPITDRVDVDKLPLSESSQIKITWEDPRTLTEILLDYSKNVDKPLNADSTLFFNLTKRK